MGKGSRKTHQGAKEARARKPSGDTADASAAGKNSDSKLWLALVLLIGKGCAVAKPPTVSQLMLLIWNACTSIF
ncbi:hypothetical protein Tcan_13948 [Toxocara canis]|uniref:Uncharacterized protein n=1 Tax=Toxocara canis TaxID=6265 RepID=A0A0B2VAP3_TOXCA|nr:hypothetical protein Tcan_13948 [Toxocara canis]